MKPELNIKCSFKLLKDAIEIYGADNQIDVAIEEMAELIKCLTKYKRSNNIMELEQYYDLINHIAEEVADVYIMLEQTEIMFNISEDIHKWKIYKAQRLRERIEEARNVNTSAGN